MKSKIIGEFKKCPNCDSEELCAPIGCEGIVEIPEGELATAKKEVVFLKQPQFAGVSIPALVYSYDVCAKCGTYRCVRVERQNIPVQAQQGMPPPSFGSQGGMPPFMGKG